MGQLRQGKREEHLGLMMRTSGEGWHDGREKEQHVMEQWEGEKYKKGERDGRC